MILPAAHRLSNEPHVDLKDLEDETLIELNTNPSLTNTKKVFESDKASPSRAIQVSQMDLVRSMVARGLGYRLLMARPNQVKISTDGLPFIEKRLSKGEFKSAAIAISDENFHLSTRAEALLRAFQDHYGDTVWHSQ